MSNHHLESGGVEEYPQGGGCSTISPAPCGSTGNEVADESIKHPLPKLDQVIPLDTFVCLSCEIAVRHQIFVEKLLENGIRVYIRSQEEAVAAEARSTARMREEEEENNSDSQTAKNSSLYSGVLSQHYAFNKKHAAPERKSVTQRPYKILVFETNQHCLREAASLGMCTIGFARSVVEMKHLLNNCGAAVVGHSLEALLDRFGIEEVYQVQYLALSIRLATSLAHKAGYPVSLLDMLRGRYTEDGVEVQPAGNLSNSSEKVNGVADQISSTILLAGATSSCAASERLVPRKVLGVEPGSLADDYVNNIGWTNDTCRSLTFHSRDMEKEIVEMFGRYFNLEPLRARGFVTNGGTEGNFAGMWWQRDFLRANSINRGPAAHAEAEGQFNLLDDDVPQPILMASEQTHYSVFKAAQQLCLPIRRIATDSTGSIDVDAFRSALEEIQRVYPGRSILWNANCGTTQTCAIDDLYRVRQVLIQAATPPPSSSTSASFNSSSSGGKEHNACGSILSPVEEPCMFRWGIHLDGALMGGVLPLINPYPEADLFGHQDQGEKETQSDGGKIKNIFDALSVCTVAISGHKFFGSTSICGLCLTTADFLKKCFENEDGKPVTYVIGLHDITPSGSRSGYSVISFHNTLCALGMHQTKTRRGMEENSKSSFSSSSHSSTTAKGMQHHLKGSQTNRRKRHFTKIEKICNQCYANKAIFISKMTAIVGADNVRTAGKYCLNVWFPRPPESDRLVARYNLMPIKLPSSSSSQTSPAPSSSAAGCSWQGEWCAAAMLLNMSSGLIEEFCRSYENFWNGNDTNSTTVAGGLGDNY